MRMLGLLVVALVLLFPAPARAQGKLADFAGMWVGGRVDNKTGQVQVVDDTLVLRADSTYKMDSQFVRWGRVAGDTVAFEKTGTGFRLTLKDQKLFRIGLGTNKGFDYSYTRADTSATRTDTSATKP